MLRDRQQPEALGETDAALASEPSVDRTTFTSAGAIPPVAADGAPAVSASDQAFGTPVERGRERVASIEAARGFDGSMFHGTSSDMLPGLARTDGRLCSGAQLVREGIARTTGEGDAYVGSAERDSRVDGRQDIVSVGLGAAGFGSALTYAQGSQTMKNLNVQAYSDPELAAAARELRFVVDNYDALKIELETFPNGKIEKFQFAERLRQLEAEQKRREQLPANHPNREGITDPSRFPLVFEMNAPSDAQPYSPGLRPGMNFAGEAGVKGQVDLKGALRRVYCPAQHVASVRGRLVEILGHDGFEVIPLESLDALSATGDTRTTEVATTATVEGLESAFQKFVHAYADAARTGATIDDNYVIDRVWNS